jgi:hypothetical protein
MYSCRLLVPTTGTSAPTGWAVLPVFERAGPYVASGTYQLPLFQGVPSRYIIQVGGWGVHQVLWPGMHHDFEM